MIGNRASDQLKRLVGLATAYSNQEPHRLGVRGLAPGRGVGVAPPQDTETTWSALSADTRRRSSVGDTGIEPVTPTVSR